jgi:hypothetical protein
MLDTRLSALTERVVPFQLYLPDPLPYIPPPTVKASPEKAGLPA